MQDNCRSSALFPRPCYIRCDNIANFFIDKINRAEIIHITSCLVLYLALYLKQSNCTRFSSKGKYRYKFTCLRACTYHVGYVHVCEACGFTLEH